MNAAQTTFCFKSFPRGSCLFLAWIGLPCAAHAADPPRCVSSREIVLSFQTTDAAAVEQAEAWVSTDQGRTWQPAETLPVGKQALRYDAPADGHYDFYLVLRNAFGVSAPPPVPGSPPHFRVLVDTLPPALQIHKVAALSGTARPTLRFSVSLIEENLGEAGVRIFYKTGGEKFWSDGGRVSPNNGVLLWSPPEIVERLEGLRVVVTDLAGNQAAEEIRNPPSLAPASSATASQPVGLPANPRGDFTLSESVERPAPPQLEHPASPARLEKPMLERPNIERVPRVQAEEKNAPPPANSPAIPAGTLEPKRRSPLQLHELAARYIAEGKYGLAAARLEDALEAYPQDADLLVDLGRVLHRSGRSDEAVQRFQTALQRNPDHLGALDGLALIAVSQKQYAAARPRLQQLLKLSPESGKFWLRYGDNEYRLGETDAAVQAWQKVLGAKETSPEDHDSAQRKLKYFGPARSQP